MKHSTNSHQFRFSTSQAKIEMLKSIAQRKGISLTKLINNTLDELIEAQEYNNETERNKP